METFTVPLIAAAVFTAGGYAITCAERHAEAVGDWLFTMMMMVALVGGAILANQALERRLPAWEARRAVAEQSRSVSPPPQAWAQVGP